MARLVVGYSGGLDHDARLWKLFHDGIAHVFGRLHEDGSCSGWRLEDGRPAYQDHARAHVKRGFREGVSHLTAGAVADVTHRINWLSRWACGDEHSLVG